MKILSFIMKIRFKPFEMENGAILGLCMSVVWDSPVSRLD